MNKIVLFFNFNDKEAVLLKTALQQLGAQLVFAAPEDQMSSVGSLLGLPVMTTPDSLPGNVGGKMLIMSGFDQDDIRALLSLMKNAGFGRDVLKAVATPANISWTPARLWKELSLEHMQFGSGR